MFDATDISTFFHTSACQIGVTLSERRERTLTLKSHSHLTALFFPNNAFYFCRIKTRLADGHSLDCQP